MNTTPQFLLRLAFVVFFLASLQVSTAQCGAFPKQSVSVSYFGHMATHPGLKVGAEHLLWQNYKVKQKKYGSKAKYRQLFAAANLGLYGHRDNHTGLFLSADLGYRKLNDRGTKWELYTSLGYLKTFNAGTTYDASDANNIVARSSSGRNYFINGLTLGYGKDLTITKSIPWAWHIRLGVWGQRPYNTGSLPVPYTELGLSYKLNY